MNYPSFQDHATRRRFLQAGLRGTGSLALANLGLSAMSEAKDTSAKDGVIDAHVHVWTPDTDKYPLAAGHRRDQMKPPSFTPKQLMDLAGPCGISRVVLIQMSFYGFDNSYMLDTMKKYPGVYSGVAVINSNAKRPQDRMRSLAKQGVRGFRIYPANRAVDRWLTGPGMQEMWKCGAEEGLAMCNLVNPGDLPEIDRMCRKYPQTPVVVDHFARIGVDGQIRDKDLESLCGLAKHKNTSVKVSAYYALGKKKAPYTDLGGMVRRLLDAYGPERLMWATDCPFQVQDGHTYHDSVELVRSKLDFLSAGDKEWILKKTAERVFFS